MIADERSAHGTPTEAGPQPGRSDRAFTRIGVDAVPDAKTILKIAQALGPDVITDLHQRVVDVAKRAGVTQGRRFRIDTAVVETNIHYPTDSTLLQDGVGTLTRTMARAATALGDDTVHVRDRRRSVVRRCLAIRVQSRSPKTRPALIRSYRRLMAITRAVQHNAATMIRRIGQRVRTARGGVAATLVTTQRRLQQLRPLIDRVLAQTRARLLGGDTHVSDKVLSTPGRGSAIIAPHGYKQRRAPSGRPVDRLGHGRDDGGAAAGRQRAVAAPVVVWRRRAQSRCLRPTDRLPRGTPGRRAVFPWVRDQPADVLGRQPERRREAGAAWRACLAFF